MVSVIELLTIFAIDSDGTTKTNLSIRFSNALAIASFINELENSQAYKT